MKILNKRALVGTCFTLSLLLGEGRALAQAGADDKAAAEALFDQAKKLLEEKKYAEACPRFERSQKLDPGIGTLLYLADCYEGLGRVASAWATFREAASMAKTAGQGQREVVARTRAQALEPKLHRLKITVGATETPGLVVRRNGADLRKEVWGEAIPVDPGEYTIEATAPRKKPWSIRIQVPADPGTQAVSVPPLPEDPNAPKEPGPGAPAPQHDDHAVGRTQRIVGLVVGGFGVVGVGVAATFGGLAMAANNEVKEKCPNRFCADPAIVNRSTTAGTFADASTAMFVVGGVALAAGIVVFVTSPSRRAPTHAWVTPTFGPGSAGFTMGRTF